MLGQRVDAVGMKEAVELVLSRAAEGEPGAYVNLTNVHTTVEAQNDPAVRVSAQDSFLSVPDGMPLVWILRRRGHPHAGKVTGIEYVPRLIEAGLANGVRHYLYGGGPGIAERARRALQERFPDASLVGASAPPFAPGADWDVSGLAEDLRATRADILWVGLGAPKQELWMARNAGVLPVPVMIGVGAAFDFLAGTKRAAPAWSRHIGLEWAFRLVSEPKRLWRRYVLGNLRFVALLLADRRRSHARP